MGAIDTIKRVLRIRRMQSLFKYDRMSMDAECRSNVSGLNRLRGASSSRRAMTKSIGGIFSPETKMECIECFDADVALTLKSSGNFAIGDYRFQGDPVSLEFRVVFTRPVLVWDHSAAV